MSAIAVALQSLPEVRVIVDDEQKTVCSVKVTVVRNEQVNSGSMMFHHPRYITLGQTVVFSDTEAAEICGALFFKASPDEAVEIIKNLQDHIPHEKEEPEHSIIIKE